MQSSIRMLFPDIWDLNTSIFGRGSNFLESAAISTAIHCASGLFVVFRTSPSYDSSSHSNSRRFDVLYQILLAIGELIAVFSIAVLNSDPKSWPPVFDQPWLSTSLHEFWGQRWHQLFRQMFLFAGGYPLQAILSPLGKAVSEAGFLFGTFLASALVHNVGFYATGTTPGWPCILFFTGQSVGLCLERAWRAATGKRVGGLVGWLWVVLWIVGLGQWCGE